VWLVGAACGVLAALAYLGALHNPFVYDDRLTVVENASLRTPSDLRFLFGYSLFRPLVNLSYAADYALWGLDPFGYHLTSLALHVVNVGLVYTLALRMAGAARAPVAAVPAALFAVHPLMTEAVGYVSGRSEVLCGLFFLAGLLLARRALLSLRLRDTALAVVAMLLALAAKEVAAGFPLVVLAYDRLLLEGSPDERRLRVRRVHVVLFLLVLAGAAARVFVYVRHEGGPSASVWRNALLQLGISWRYLGLLVWPRGQSIVHEFAEVPGLLDLATLASAAGVALVFTVSHRLRARAPLLLFGAIWFYATLAPSSALPLNEAMAEHRAYLPSIGVFLCVAAGVDAFGHRLALVPVVALLVVLTVERNRVWSDRVRLWQDAVAKSPSTYATHDVLADLYRERGDCRSAVGEYERAIAILPGEVGAWLNLGICRAELGEPDLARQAFEEAMARAPGLAGPHFDLGLLAEKRGDRDEARRQYRAALALDPTHERARGRLAVLGDP